MLCISLWQPWAHLCVIGAKQYETRHWPTNVRGTVGIHAAKRWTKEEREFCNGPFFCEFFGDPSILSFGAVIGTVDIVDCLPAESLLGGLIELLGEERVKQERAFGNYSPGRFAWKLENPVKFETPIMLPGRQGFFDVLPEYLAEVD